MSTPTSPRCAHHTNTRLGEQSLPPIRECPIAQERIIAGARSEHAKRAALSREPPPLQVPKELWRLVDYAYKQCVESAAVCMRPYQPPPDRCWLLDVLQWYGHAWCMCREWSAGGDGASARGIGHRSPHRLWRQVRGTELGGACCTTDVLMPTVVAPLLSVVSVGATLIELLRSLDDAVVPARLFPHSEFHSVPVSVWYVRMSCVAPTTVVTVQPIRGVRCRNLLQQLDLPSYHTFTYVICFARELLAHRSANELDVDVAAEVFAKALMRAPLSDDMDAVATAASAMTTTTPLRSGATSTSVSSVLAELLMTPAQLSAAKSVITYFLTWQEDGVDGASAASDGSPL